MNKAEVLYCYRCGKRVSRDAGSCLYCSTPTRRTIRPARHCPFCDEEIGHRAVKCPHCGEFLDGRPKEAAVAGQQGNQQVFFIIDKAIIQGDQPLMLQGGGPVPPEVAQRLSQQTLKAIQKGNPALLDQQGVRALPAPAQAEQPIEYAVEGSAVLDVVPQAPPRYSEVGEAPGKGQNQGNKAGKQKDYLPVPSSGAVVPAEQPEEQGNLGTQFSRALVRGAGYALAKAGSFAVDVWAGQKAKAEPGPGADDPEDRYSLCSNCNTEVLRDDIFCFHCGVILRPDAAPRPRRVRDVGKPTFGILVFALILMGLMVFGKGYIGKYAELYSYMGYAIPAMAVISFLLIISAFFRKRTSLNQIMVVLFLVLWAVAVVFGVWLAD